MTQLKGDDIYHDLRVLEALYPDHYIGSWSPEDYRTFAEDLTDEECVHVTQRLNKYHDAGVGINWDVIEFHVEVVLSERNIIT